MVHPTAPEASAVSDLGKARAVDPSWRNTWVLTVFTAITNLTDGVTKVALPLMATSLTDKPALVSGVFLTLTLPWLLAALHVGVLVDRADRRGLLWLANGMRIAVIIGLSAAVAAHVISLPMLYAGGIVLGVAEVIALTSAAALIPDAVAPPGRDRANAWVTGAETVCNEFAGPFLGGLLFAAGTMIAFGASTGGYLIAMVVLPLLVGTFKVKRTAGGPMPSVNSQIGEGLRFLWHQRLLRMFAFTVMMLVTCWAAWYALMPLVAIKEWGLGPIGYGALAGALGIGGIAGALGVNTANRLFGRRRVMFSNVFLTCSMVVAPAVTPNAWAVGAAAFLGGMGSAMWVVNTRSISQMLVSPEMMGRYNSVAKLFGWGSIPLGAALAGGLAQWLGYRFAFGVFAVATTVVIIPFLRTFTPEVLADLESRGSAQ
jgi:MFS family permease